MSLRRRQYLAGGLFVFGKLNSVACAVTLFVNLRLALVLLIMTIIGIAGAIAVCWIDLKSKPRQLTDIELKTLLSDPRVQGFIKEGGL